MPRRSRARSRPRRRRPSSISSPISPSRPARRSYQEGLERNARLRIEGTRNLVAAAQAPPACARMIAQSIAFIYAPGRGRACRERSARYRRRGDGAAPSRRRGARRGDAGDAGRHRAALRLSLRAGHLVRQDKRAKPALHVDAAAQAACSRSTKGARGIYNIAEDDGAVSSEKAKRELGFDAGAFRLNALNGLLQKRREPFEPDSATVAPPPW